jgi:hypothetical protein
VKKYSTKEQILTDIDKLEAAKIVCRQNNMDVLADNIDQLVVRLACEFTRQYREDQIKHANQEDPFS